MKDLDLDELLAAERERPAPPAEAKAAVAAQLATLLGPGGGGAGGGGGGSGAGAGESGTGTGTGTSTGVSSVAGAAATKVAVGVMVGALAGGAAVGMVMPPRVVERVVTREVPAAQVAVTASSTAASTASVSVDADSGVVARVPGSARPAGSSARADRDVELARERALVDRARSALARGDRAGALAAADEHRATFPRGQLEEEREVVAIQALAAAGRADEAGTRAGAFRKNHPTSLLLPIVDAALRPR